jgi:hypothetical protein
MEIAVKLGGMDPQRALIVYGFVKDPNEPAPPPEGDEPEPHR